jgi:CDGSH-type Zn-finger protein
MADIVDISIRPSGPYLVRGAVTLHDGNGTAFDLAGKDVIALCRCGASTTKPFCDGTHSKIGFQAANEAVRQSE